eukprot:TRINITY_DN74230_c0_g1_i1.p1 TRINITY_DN74230_c0_g1~~TRINITY_DN74230_c0_g1_i1.p1  ORF type:complete len:577 (+),score=138.64 TRINITY_DN74230_c0_g1_i1:75-1733(+)
MAPPAPPENFEAGEAAVLNWLLEKADVADAVDLAIAGKQSEALGKLLPIVRGLLEEAAPPVAPASPEDGPEAAPANGKRNLAELPDGGPLAAKRHRGAGQARSICIVVQGMHGSGKSALCNVLREVLGGQWLNADEFAASSRPKVGRNKREAFCYELRTMLLKGLASSEQNKAERIVFVDRMGSLRSKRSDVIQTLRKLRWNMRGGTVLLVDFTHSADTFGYGTDSELSKRYSEQHLTVCQERIDQRGFAHHGAALPSPKLKASLQVAAKAFEALDSNELGAFDSRMTVDVTKSPPEMAASVVDELRKLNWLPGMKTSEELKPRMQVAWQAYQRAETRWRESLAADQSANRKPRDWLEECTRAREAERAHEKEKAKDRAGQKALEEHETMPASDKPLYWKIDLPDVSKVLAQRGILPGNFVPVEKPHVTLLYIGLGDTADGAKRSGMSVEKFESYLQALDGLKGLEFDVKMTEIVIEEHVAIARVQLPPTVPCANREPHVTLGTVPGVAPRYANEVLEDLKAGRKEGVTCIQLPVPRPLKGRVGLHYATPLL